ncbi:unnamed protein product, partial [Allacma fusca]
ILLSLQSKSTDVLSELEYLQLLILLAFYSMHPMKCLLYYDNILTEASFSNGANKVVGHLQHIFNVKNKWWRVTVAVIGGLICGRSATMNSSFPWKYFPEYRAISNNKLFLRIPGPRVNLETYCPIVAADSAVLRKLLQEQMQKQIKPLWTSQMQFLDNRPLSLVPAKSNVINYSIR